ncbi:MAG TPA: hypothetical protein PK916_11240 [Bacteroidota bacterium]|nr:hypothetical protein [Bacteroidota bacterium]
MKRAFLLLALLAAVGISACDNEASAPADGFDAKTLLKAVEQVNLDNEQLAQIDEMFWLEEDISASMNSSQLDALNSVISATSPDFASPRDPRRIAFDIAAMVRLRLILKANPDLDEETKLALVELIKASNATRRQIIRDNLGNPEVLRALLKAEHDRLIAQMNALLTPEQREKVETLVEQLRQLREELREKWKNIRVDRQLALLRNVLELSDEQAAAIKELLLAQHDALKELRETYKDDPEGFREALKALLADTDAAIIALLTAEQAEKWDLLKTLRMKWRQGRG